MAAGFLNAVGEAHDRHGGVEIAPRHARKVVGKNTVRGGFATAFAPPRLGRVGDKDIATRFEVGERERGDGSSSRSSREGRTSAASRIAVNACARRPAVPLSRSARASA